MIITNVVRKAHAYQQYHYTFPLQSKVSPDTIQYNTYHQRSNDTALPEATSELKETNKSN